ncbi:unnamed protein product, partial [marine sediment metagenome]
GDNTTIKAIYKNKPHAKTDNGSCFEAAFTTTERITTALSLAVKTGNKQLASLLLEHGAQEVINEPNYSLSNSYFVAEHKLYGKTPIFMALNAKDEEMCLLLLAHGAYANAIELTKMDNGEHNCLVLAAQNNMPRVCRAIIARTLSALGFGNIKHALKPVMEQAYEQANSDEVCQVVNFESIDQFEETIEEALTTQTEEKNLALYLALTFKQADKCLHFLEDQSSSPVDALYSFNILGKKVNALVKAAESNMPTVCAKLIDC